MTLRSGRRVQPQGQQGSAGLGALTPHPPTRSRVQESSHCPPRQSPTGSSPLQSDMPETGTPSVPRRTELDAHVQSRPQIPHWLYARD